MSRERPRNENSRPRGICHCCKAGQLEIPFEDTRPTAAWRRTLFAEDDQVFSSRPTLLDRPHEPHKAPDFFTYDLWHAFHLGLGKTFTASVLAMMSEQIGAFKHWGTVLAAFCCFSGLLRWISWIFIYHFNLQGHVGVAGYKNFSKWSMEQRTCYNIVVQIHCALVSREWNRRRPTFPYGCRSCHRHQQFHAWSLHFWCLDWCGRGKTSFTARTFFPDIIHAVGEEGVWFKSEFVHFHAEAPRFWPLRAQNGNGIIATLLHTQSFKSCCADWRRLCWPYF